jgi:hypothetical protein
MWSSRKESFSAIGVDAESHVSGNEVTDLSQLPTARHERVFTDEATTACIAIQPVHKLFERTLLEVIRFDIVNAQVCKVREPRIISPIGNPSLVDHEQL